MSSTRCNTGKSIGISIVAVSLLAAGCSSSANRSSSPDGASQTPGGAAKKVTGTIVAFVPTTTQNYVAGWARGAKAEAKKQGLKLKLIQNNFDQSAEDGQVRQYLASGDKAAALIWWPTDAVAGRASLQLLAASKVPVVQTNQEVVPGTAPFLAAYAGVNDAGNGKVTGQNVVDARDAMKKAGLRLHSAGGNVVIIGLASGYQAGITRTAAIKKVVGAAGMKVIDTIDAGFDAASGYKFGSQLITRAKSRGIDVVVSMIDDETAGVVRALKEQGFHPGKDVYVVAGTCSSGTPYIKNKEEFATGIQPSQIEGGLAVSTAVQAAAGQLTKFTNRFMPNQSITLTNMSTYKLDGQSVSDLCSQ